ncbi:MAG: alpha/beta fold hydrolase [Gemmatimonadota bacterium]
MRIAVPGGLMVIGLILVPAPAAAQQIQPGVIVRSANCEHRSNTYQLYSPDSGRALPAIVLLHGAGGEPNDLMEPWQKLARKQGIVLIAPELPRLRSYEAVAPAIFRCLAEDARGVVRIDSSRIYLFGYSMGGYLAFDAAMRQSEYFAGAMVYANGIEEEYYGIVDQAVRKLPIALYGGDQDQVIPIRVERQTHDFLVRKGFRVHYRELEGRSHFYTPVADWINRDAWGWISKQSPAR